MDSSTFSLDARLSWRKRTHGSPWWRWLAASQRWLDGHILCALCGQCWPFDLERELQWDRIVPGGPYTLRNGQLVCHSCNSAKGQRPNAEALRHLAETRGMTTWERTLRMERRERERYRTDAEYRERRQLGSRKWAKSAVGREWHAGNRERARAYDTKREPRERKGRGRARFGLPGGNAPLPL